MVVEPVTDVTLKKKKATHTPGPWHVVLEGRGTNPNVGDWAVDGPRGGSITTYCALYDAHLIAVAPELLATMKKMAEGWTVAIELGLLPPQHVATATILRDEANATILKATSTSSADAKHQAAPINRTELE